VPKGAMSDEIFGIQANDHIWLNKAVLQINVKIFFISLNNVTKLQVPTRKLYNKRDRCSCKSLGSIKSHYLWWWWESSVLSRDYNKSSKN
jgi:hypothetical protein